MNHRTPPLPAVVAVPSRRSLRPRLAALLALVGAASPLGAQTVATWDPGSGDFNDANHWTPALVPAGYEYSAIIDSGAGAGAGWTVTHSSVRNLGRLRVGPRDQFVLGGGISLSAAEFPTGGVLSLAGTLQFSPTTGGALYFASDGSLTGGGTIVFPPDAQVADGLLQIPGTKTLTNQNVTIRGNGRILMDSDNGLGSPVSYFHNQAAGVIRAATGDSLLVSGGRIANAGLFEAGSGGLLTLSNNIFDGSEGSVIDRLPGGELRMETATLAGETLRSAAAGGGEFKLLGAVFDGTQRRVKTQGVLKFDGGFNLLTGSIENQGELRFQMVFGGGGVAGLFVRDFNGVGATLRGEGVVDFLPDEKYYAFVASDPYTPGVHTLVNFDNTINGRVTFTDLHVRNEAAGRIEADRAGQAITFQGQSTTGVAAVLVNAGYLGAKDGGNLVVEREVITLGGATTGVQGNGLLTYRNGAIITGPLINGNTSFNVFNNRGIELLGDCVLDGRPLAGGAPNPVRLTGFFYAQDIVLRGETKAADAPAAATIQNAGRIRIDGQASLNRLTVLLADDGLGSGSNFVVTQPNTDVLTLGNSALIGGGSIGVTLQILPGSSVEANGGPLTLEAVDTFGDPLVVINHNRLEAAMGGVLHLRGTVANLPFPSFPLPAIVAFPNSLVRITGTVGGGTISNQGTNQKGLASAIEIDGGTLDGVTLVAADLTSFQFYFFADSSSTLRGTITNHANVKVREGSGGGTRLTIDGPVVLGGTGKIDFEGSGSGIVAAGGNATLTQLAGHSLTGSAVIGVPFTNHGRVVVPPGQIATFNQPISGSGDYQTTNGRITFVQPPSFSGPTAGVQASGPTAVIQLPASNALAGAQLLSQDQALLQSNTAAGLGANGPGSGIVAVGGGNVVAMGGGNVVALGGGNVVALGGGNVVALGGGNVVALGGGNVVANGGGNVVANGGGNRPARFGADGAPPPLTSAIIAEAGGTLGGGGIFAAQNGVWIQSGAFLAPGNSLGTMSITGALTIAAGGRLLTEIGGLNPATEHDRVAVSGLANLAGDLQVTLANGFVPVAGQTFTILTAGTVTGTFSGLSLPVLPGRLTFRVSYGAQAVVLSVDLIGSFAEWQRSRFSLEDQSNPLVSGPLADPDGDGLSNKAEYFFGSEPTAAGSRARVVTSLVPDGLGGRHATLTFPRAQGLTDPTFAIDRNLNLALPNNWFEVTSELVSAIPVPGAGVDTLTVRVLPALGAGDTKQFFEVRVP